MLHSAAYVEYIYKYHDMCTYIYIYIHIISINRSITLFLLMYRHHFMFVEIVRWKSRLSPFVFIGNKHD